MSALRNIESWMERTLTKFIDFFYPPFRKVMSLELFRYAACGGMNLVLEWVLYYVFYYYVFHEQVFDLGFIAFTPHIAAFVFKFPITFLTGFWMARHISFSGSTLKGRTQIVRYFLVTIGNILMNYFGLKLFVEEQATTIFSTSPTTLQRVTMPISAKRKPKRHHKPYDRYNMDSSPNRPLAAH